MTAAADKKKTFYCRKCEARFSEKHTRCPNESCKAWNTIVEGTPDMMSTIVVRMNEVDPESSIKTPTGMTELDAALGGGTVQGQVIQLGGGPGAGKSTLLMGIADAMRKRQALNLDTGKRTRKKNEVLYNSTEESVEKLRGRSDRLDMAKDILLCHNRVWNEIEADFAEHQPQYGIIDSLDMLTDSSTQLGKVAIMKRIYEFAHSTDTTMFVSSHINSDGEISGMVALQHVGDTIMLLSRDDKTSDVRTLQTLKNRHGPEDYVGLFEMTGKGLISYDPTRHLSEGKLLPGQAFAMATIGGKCFPIEVQALTQSSERPRLSVVGYPEKRVEALLAVIGSRTRVDVSGRDIFVSIVGGVHFQDTAIDAAIAMAIASTIEGKALPQKVVYSGEIDLLGQMKVGARKDQRKEVSERHGFRLAIADTLSDLLDEAGLE